MSSARYPLFQRLRENLPVPCPGHRCHRATQDQASRCQELGGAGAGSSSPQETVEALSWPKSGAAKQLLKMKAQSEGHLLWVSGERVPELLHLILPLSTTSMTSPRNERFFSISHSCALNPSSYIFPTHLPICLLVPGKCQLNPTLFRKLFSEGGSWQKTWAPVPTLPIAV